MGGLSALLHSCRPLKEHLRQGLVAGWSRHACAAFAFSCPVSGRFPLWELPHFGILCLGGAAFASWCPLPGRRCVRIFVPPLREVPCSHVLAPLSGRCSILESPLMAAAPFSL